MMQIINVNKRFRGVQALNAVNLSVGKGEIIGLFGENGAGKTTLMKSILGFLPFEGEILIDGEKVSRHNIAMLSFATSEHSFFPNLNALDHKAFYALHFETFNAKRFDRLVTFFELPERKALKHLSTGQKNQFEVIFALCQGARYILMDEPFAGNDIFNREDFYKVLLGLLTPDETVILSTHLIEEVEHFISRAVLIRKGEIVGDMDMLELENTGQGLVDYVKTTYRYRGDRVQKALAELDQEEAL